MKSVIEEHNLQDTWLPFTPVENTFVASADGRGVGFISITLTEDRRGIVEGAIVSPSLPAEVRNEIMELLSAKVEEQAKHLKLKAMLLMTRDKNTVLRAAKHGGSILDLVVVSKYY